MTIKVYFHICAIGHATELVREFINAIHLSGLYDAIGLNGIYCCMSGGKDQCTIIRDILKQAGRKFIIAQEVPGDQSYERLTLSYARNTIQPNDKALYIHTKSVSLTGNKLANVMSWIRMMIYHLIKGHRECIELLENNDVVGCNLHNNGGTCPYHFSGNFFWVRGDYFASLPEEIGPDYYAPEFYVCRSGPRAVSLHDSNVNHYDCNYSYNRYVDSDLDIKSIRKMKL